MMQSLDQQKVANLMYFIWPDCFGTDNTLSCKVEVVELEVLNTKQVVSASLLRSDGYKRKMTWREAKLLGYDLIELLPE